MEPYPRPTRRDKVYDFDQMYYWASGGLIRIEDRNTGDFVSVNPDDFEERMNALGGEIRFIIQADERQKMISIVNDMSRCIADARAQGNPLDPDVQDHHSRHKAHVQPMVQVDSPVTPAPRKILVAGEEPKPVRPGRLILG